MSDPLDQKSWARLSDLLCRAAELPCEVRPRLVAELRGQDPELAADAEGLLDELERVGLLDSRAVDAFADLFDDPHSEETGEPPVGTRVGPYRLVKELGRGGMGVVFLAEREDGQFEQRTALKLIKRGLDSEAVLARFRRERQILARLEHRSIARLLDGGVSSDGQSYFAMELVEGEPITKACDRQRLTIDERLALVRSVCGAVQYAHRNLVVHRDLKPSNVLLTAEGELKLLDFGIAKVLGEDGGGDATELTEFGQRALTPEYAAPEQLKGEPVSTATDVYSLGVLLFELLTGRRPFTSARGRPELERHVLEVDAPRPSDAIAVRTDSYPPDALIAHARRETPISLRRRLRGDLDAIVLQCLRKEPGRRYGSPSELADDLERYLTGRPVRARTDSFGYRLSRFVLRHLWGVAATLLVATLLLSAAAAVFWQSREAAAEAKRAERMLSFLLQLFEEGNPLRHRPEDLTARDLIEAGGTRAEAELSDDPELQIELLTVLGRISRHLALYDDAEQMLAKALALRRRVYGSQHPKVAVGLSALAELSHARHHEAQAEQLYREALEIQQDSAPQQSLQIAAILRGLAGALRNQGRMAEAEPLYRRAIAIFRGDAGAAAGLADSLNDLALLLTNDARLDEAEALQREALALHQATLGHEHLDTVTSKSNLAYILQQRGDLDAAERLYREVLAFDRARLGSDHPYTANAMSSIAWILQQRGRSAEAEKIYREVLQLNRQIFGEQHTVTAATLHSLALVLQSEHKLTEAERMVRDALGIYEGVNGHQHRTVGSAYAALASILRDRGELRDADQAYLTALQILAPQLPTEHPWLATIRLGRGRLLLATGQLDQAELLLREARQGLELAFGPNHQRTAEAAVWLAQALIGLNRQEEARQLLEANLPNLIATLGKDHETTRRAQAEFARLEGKHAGIQN